MVEDDVVGGSVLDLMHTKASVELPAGGAPLHLLTLHVENVDHYFGLEIDLDDASGRPHRIAAANNQSLVRVRGNECSVPLVTDSGWICVSLDLRDMMQRAFGVSFGCVRSVFVHAVCRVWHAYLHDQPVADALLPENLRVQRSSPASLQAAIASGLAEAAQAAAGK